MLLIHVETNIIQIKNSMFTVEFTTLESLTIYLAR